MPQIVTTNLLVLRLNENVDVFRDVDVFSCRVTFTFHSVVDGQDMAGDVVWHRQDEVDLDWSRFDYLDCRNVLNDTLKINETEIYFGS